MTTNPCQPNAPGLLIDNPCAMLPALRGALFQLMTGQAKAEVRFGDQTLRYHPGNVDQLRAEVRKLELMCNPNGTPSHRGRAVQYGRQRPIGFIAGRYF